MVYSNTEYLMIAFIVVAATGVLAYFLWFIYDNTYNKTIEYEVIEVVINGKSCFIHPSLDIADMLSNVAKDYKCVTLHRKENIILYRIIDLASKE